MDPQDSKSYHHTSRSTIDAQICILRTAPAARWGDSALGTVQVSPRRRLQPGALRALLWQSPRRSDDVPWTYVGGDDSTDEHRGARDRQGCRQLCWQLYRNRNGRQVGTRWEGSCLGLSPTKRVHVL